VLAITDDWLATVRVPVVRVDNEGPIKAIDDQIAAHLTRLIGPSGFPGADAWTGPTFEPGFVALPRPTALRALVRRPGAGGRPRPPEAVLARLGIRPRGTARRAGGGRSSSLILDTDRGRVLLKRYKPTVELGTVRGEHAVLRHLEAAGFPAPRLIAGDDGATIAEDGDRLYAAFRFIDGHRRADAHLLAPAARRRFVHAAGATLGRLHATLAGFVPPTTSPNGFISTTGPRVRDADWYRARIAGAADATRGSAHPAAHEVHARLDALTTELDRLDATLRAAEPARGVVHGDYGPYNLLVRPGRPIVVVDFELARLDWWLTDLATAIPRFATGRRGWSGNRAIAFVQGYLGRRAVPPPELDLVPDVGAFLALRRAIVCVARWAETTDDEWLAEATEKMNLATAYVERRHPLIAAIAAVRAG
jgi:Ser/Thr protein kinase RdoA (MazF antagonist)